MNAWSCAAALSLGGAVWLLLARSTLPGLRSVSTQVAGGSGRLRPPPVAGATTARRRRVTDVAAGAAVVLVLPGWFGWCAGAVAILVLERWLARLPDRATAAAAIARRQELPLALELMAAALTAGATTSAAVELAAEGTGPELGRTLHDVAASLRLGAGPDEAWRPVLDLPAIATLGRLALRSTASGAAMAAACSDLAAHERAIAVVRAQVAIKRAGVLAALPLGLCFLPAFLLVGVVPIVAGLLRTLTW